MSAGSRPGMRMRVRIKWFVWSVDNRLRGYAFRPIKRCRKCGHSLMPSERPCQHCRAEAAS